MATDIVGDKIGRIHLGKQDLAELQTRKMKGLKRSRDKGAEGAGEPDDMTLASEGEEGAGDPAESKRQKLHS